MSPNISSPLPIEVEALNNRICDWHGNLDVWQPLASLPARIRCVPRPLDIWHRANTHNARSVEAQGFQSLDVWHRLHRSRFESAAKWCQTSVLQKP